MSADITKTVAPKTDQLNSDDFFAENTKIIRITGVKETGSKEQPISIYYEGDNGKPWKPSLGMRRVLLDVWGQEAGKEASKYYVGRVVQLYRDPDVAFGGVKVGGIRISHVSHIQSEKKIAVTVSKARRIEFVVKPFVEPKKTEQKQSDPSADRIRAMAKRVVLAIESSSDLADLTALWDVDYKADIAEIEAASAPAFKFVKDAFDKRMGSFENGEA